MTTSDTRVPVEMAHASLSEKAAIHDALCELCLRYGWTDGRLYDFVRAILEAHHTVYAVMDPGEPPNETDELYSIWATKELADQEAARLEAAHGWTFMVRDIEVGRPLL